VAAAISVDPPGSVLTAITSAADTDEGRVAVVHA
jgi:hypothetical protein